MSKLHDDTVDLSQGIRLDRREVLTTALLSAGAVVIGPPGAALAAPGDKRHDFEVAQPGFGDKREWVHLKLDPDGKAQAVPLTVTGRDRTEGTIKVSNSTGFVAVAAGADSSVGNHPVECAIEAATGTVWVTPRRVGSPGIPADRLIIESGSGRREIDVWVEPVGGVWGGDHPYADPIQLGITAIHAAVLHKTAQRAEVVMFSIGRDTDNKNGNYIPSRMPGSEPRGQLPTGRVIPGQWQIDIYAMHQMEARALQLADYSVIDRRMVDPKNIFCGGQAQTPDGLLMEAGGHMTPDDNKHDANFIHLYDPNASQDQAWKRFTYQMKAARWYPTVTALPDGKMLITSGSRTLPRQPREWGREDEVNHKPNGYFNVINNNYLIADPASGTVLEPAGDLIDQKLLDTINNKHLASKPNPSLRDLEGLQQLATYPAVFVLAGHDGDTVVAMVESNRAWLYTYAHNRLHRTAQFYPMNTLGSRSYPHYGSIVMLPFKSQETPRILAVGGQHENMKEHRRLVGPFSDLQATKTAEILEIDTEEMSGTWRWTGPMAHQRVLCDATLLADGQVLVSGGSRAGWGDVNEGGVRAAELYDPATASFRPAGQMSAVRRYHSTAVLLPDGTMLKAGSTGGFGSWVDQTQEKFIGNYTGERYFPAYCFRPRPAITDVNPQRPLRHGTRFTVTARGPKVTGDNAKVALIRPGSTTHGNNMDQRYIWLDHTVKFTSNTAEFMLTMPDPAAVPPGMYMLVVLFDGTPSRAHWVKVATPTYG